MNKRRLLRGGYGLAITILAIAGIILLNGAAELLAERFSLKLDLTDTELYTLSEETRAVLADMTGDVTLTVVANEAQWENRYSVMVAEAVRNYETVSGGRVRLRFLDPDLHPALSEDYPALTSVELYDIIVESDRRYTSVPSDDMLVKELNYNTYQSEVTGLQVDQVLTRALVYVLAESEPKAVFVSNHGETTDSLLRSVFDMLSYTCVDLNLAAEDIPADTTYLVFNAPMLDISEAEGKKLDAFKSAGGDIILLFSADMPKLHMLELFLGEWGIGIGTESLMSDLNSTLSRTYLSATPSTGGASHLDGVSYIVERFPGSFAYSNGARPLLSLWENDRRSENNRLYRLMNTDSGAYLAVDGEKVEGTEGAYPLVLLNHQYDYVDNVLVDSYLLVANAGLFADSALAYSEVNYYFCAYLLGDLNPAADSVYIPAKSLSGAPLTVSGWQSQLVFILLVVLMPLCIAALGILTWRRRSRL